MNSNYGWGLPISASTFSGDIDRGIYLIHTSMIILFLTAASFFVFFLIKYRARPGRQALYWHGNFLYLAIPLSLVFLDEVFIITSYAIPTWSKIMRRLPNEAESQVVQIVAEQYAWNIQYPGPDRKLGIRDAKFIDASNVLGLDPHDPAGKDDIVTLNELHIPLEKPTLVYLTSKDVIHSLFIPEFRIKKDAVPGIKVSLWFEPTRTGVFEIVCAQLCGIGHSTMRGSVIVEPQKDFENWLRRDD